jgi:hypothetical protein
LTPESLICRIKFRAGASKRNVDMGWREEGQNGRIAGNSIAPLDFDALVKI